MRKLSLLIAVFACAGASALPLKKISEATEIELPLLKAAFRAGVQLNHDPLTNRLEASASDIDLMFAFSSTRDVESRTIDVSWIQGSESLRISAIHNTQGRARYFDSAEVYVGKKLVWFISETTDYRVGNWNPTAREHEKIAIVSGPISIEIAQAIAAADPKELTIRFYSDDGYQDRRPAKRFGKRLSALLAIAAR